MNIKKNAVLFLTGLFGGGIVNEAMSGRKLRQTIRKKEDDLKKFNEFYLILLQWIRLHQEGRTAANYFRKNGFNSVAIYGMKELGEALLEELTNSEITVKYGIDRDADNVYVGVDVYKPDERLEDVDVVVVTAVHYFDEIENDLKNKIKAKIVSIEDVVWEA